MIPVSSQNSEAIIRSGVGSLAAPCRAEAAGPCRPRRGTSAAVRTRSPPAVSTGRLKIFVFEKNIVNELEKCLHPRTSVTEDSHLDKVGILQMFLQDRVISHRELLKHKESTTTPKNHFSNFITVKICLKLVAGWATYPGVLVVSDDEGWVPLRGALHPVHAQPLAQQLARHGEQQPLRRRVLGPLPHLGLGPGAHRQPGGRGVPLLQQPSS